jgi:glyoxylase-like metal-dependent hydrolase (beta-lactamase superfamily II)
MARAASGSPWREVADRVWIRRYDALDQTIGVIGDHAGELLLVVDTRASHRLADELLDEMRSLPGRVAGAVNTHGHWDHVFGNAQFRHGPIWGHVRCAEMIATRGDAMRASLLERYPPDTAEQFRDVELVAPSETFEQASTIELGDRQVELRYLGRGHTDNDIVASVLDADVLFAGDLLENAPAPGFDDSFPLAWADTGRHLVAAIDPGGVIVPGHGDPFDRAFASGQVEQIGLLSELGRQAVAGAVGLDEAIRRSPFPAEPAAVAIERVRLELAE